jgi:hypothetical protein
MDDSINYLNESIRHLNETVKTQTKQLTGQRFGRSEGGIVVTKSRYHAVPEIRSLFEAGAARLTMDYRNASSNIHAGTELASLLVEGDLTEKSRNAS